MSLSLHQLDPLLGLRPCGVENLALTYRFVGKVTLENYCAANVASEKPEWGEIAKPKVASEGERTLGFVDA